MIRVHVAASTPVARAGLEAVVRTERDFDLVGEDDVADVVVHDSEVRHSAEHTSAPIVLLAGDATRSIAGLLRNGVRAVLPQDATPAQIIAAIYAVAAGLAVVPAEEAATAIPQAMPETRSEPPPEPLTPREMQVLEMLAEGIGNKEIAARLGISDHTAKFHVNSILAKLNAGSRTEAVTRGIRAGLIMI